MTYSEYLPLLRRYLGPQSRRVVLLTLLVVGGIGLQLVNPQLVGRFLDAAVEGGDFRELIVTASLFTVIAIVGQAVKLVAAYVGEYVAWTATNSLRADLALHCLRLDMSFHQAHKPGELIERVDGDVNMLASFFSKLLIQLVSNLLLMVGALVLLWMIDPFIGAAITALAAAALVMLNILNRRIVPRWEQLRQVQSELFGYLEEWLNGTEEIQTTGAETFVLQRLYRLMRRRWLAMQSAMRLNLLVMSLPILMPTLAYIVAYVWGSRLHMQGALTIGGVYLIIYYIDLLKNPLWDLQRHVQELQQAAASINRVSRLLAESPSISDGRERLPTGPLELVFDDVSFRYGDNEPVVLDSVSFRLAPGRVLALLGRTGGGKTTLGRLVVRFHEPVSGRVLLGDGADDRRVTVSDCQLTEVRRRVGVVTQAVQLLHASVRDNITLYDDGIDDELILAAFDALGLREWLDALPRGLDTHLDSDDALSAGEAQLVALARAFIRDPGLVILDEASSRLDPATERLLEAAIDGFLAGRTSIVIAHRLETAERADDILILEEGKVIEHGRRAALLAQPDSVFNRLRQSGLDGADA